MLDFLRRAKARKLHQLGGTNQPWKVELRHGDLVAHGVFRTVELKRSMVVIDGRKHPFFRDSHLHECAAYRLSRLLAISEVPPCIVRIIEGEEGSLQLWIEEAMTDRERRQRDIDPPSTLQWMRSRQTLRLFDALIDNLDRNQGNMLIDSRGRLWFIDHTRSFAGGSKIEKVERVVWCERETWRRLRGFDRTRLERELGDLLERRQLEPLMMRRNQLVRHLEERIDDLGEGAVLYDGEGMEDRPSQEPELIDDFPADTSMPHLGG